MIDVVGNIKIDESKPERVKMLIACIHSYAFLKDTGTFVLYLQDATIEFTQMIIEEVRKAGFNPEFVFNGENTSKQYGAAMCAFVGVSKNKEDFVLNFMEDHFMMMDNERTLQNLLSFMRQQRVDVCKASFFQVEQNSKAGIDSYANVAGLGLCYENNRENHEAYSRHYGSRFYLGVNFLTTREFALKFWNRELGPRPHEYEIPEFNAAWMHRCMIPGIELQASIDDGHGEQGSNLLARPDATKFWNIYNSIT